MHSEIPSPETSPQQQDILWMGRAIALAERGRYSCAPNPMVGCILVKDGKSIAQGFHRRTGEQHAETQALQQAAAFAEGAVAYVNLEPCAHFGHTPPCADALAAAGIHRVVIAMPDPDPRVSGRGIAKLRDAGITVEVGVLGDEARDLNCGYLSRIQRKRPWLRLKSALSLDGKIALPDGSSAWITSVSSRQDNQYWRAASCALLTSARTVNQDNPLLTVRLQQKELELEQPVRQPIRIIVDSRLVTKADSRILATDGKVLIATCSDCRPAIARLRSQGAEILQFDSGRQVPLGKLMERISQDFSVNSIQTEAGSQLTAALLETHLADEWLLYIAPCLLGSDAKSLAELTAPITKMANRSEFQINDIQRIGPDLRVLLRPKAKNRT